MKLAEQQQSIIADSMTEFITQEAHGLNVLAAHSDKQLWQTAITMMLQLDPQRNHIIFSGMGKCSHIARKLAATFVSTGTPAIFIHPAEASHGDLGMINPQDIVILLSNSGETKELFDIIDYTRRYSVPLIAITSKLNSKLGQAADVCLTLPAVPEACPLGLAPTTSTTMMLALGDALALTLLRLKGFTATDFKQFHPGGKLGKMLLRVQDIMHTNMPLVDADSTMGPALIEMSTKSFGCVGIVKNLATDTLLSSQPMELIGIITDGDLRRHLNDNMLQSSVQVVMTPNPLTIPGSALMTKALALMNEHKITSLFVTANEDSRCPIGIIHIHDCLRA